MASTPDSCGLWRAVVISAPAPKATAERMMAPTLCGSVTWSSTSTSLRVAERVEALGLQRLGLDQHALMHGVASR